VELWGLRPDGVGFHFRCRGVQVRLGLYRPGRAQWQVPVWDDLWCPEEALSLWEHRPVDLECREDPQAPARLVFTDAGAPDDLVVFDGSVESDWCGYEAGLLSVGAAAELFEQLWAKALVPTARAGVAAPAARSGEDRTTHGAVVGVL
jgi:hypothetical protein